MQRSMLVLIALLVLGLPGPLRADEAPKPAAPMASKAFPASWTGTWRGRCELVRGGQSAMEFAMELHVTPIAAGAYTWTIHYGEGASKQVRRYELLPVAKEPERFRIDEKNGIVLDAFFENDRLHNRFGIGDNLIEATYERSGDALTVTLTTFASTPLSTTGGKDGVPPVTSYRLKAVQRGVLRRPSK